jgi:hypothetical protein
VAKAADCDDGNRAQLFNHSHHGHSLPQGSDRSLEQRRFFHQKRMVPAEGNSI